MKKKTVIATTSTAFSAADTPLGAANTAFSAADVLAAYIKAATDENGRNVLIEAIAAATGYKVVPENAKKLRHDVCATLSPYKGNGAKKATPAEPIRSQDEFNLLTTYLRTNGRPYNRKRNYALFVCGVTLGLRVSDLLRLTVDDVWDCEHNHPRRHAVIINKKTHKRTTDLITPMAAGAITELIEEMRSRTVGVLKPGWPLFQSMRSTKGVPQPLDETQVWRILNGAAKECGIESHVSTHTMRKTYGYAANKTMTQAGIPAAQVMEALQNKYHHSSQSITMRYIGLGQEQIDAAALTVDAALSGRLGAALPAGGGF